MDIMDNAPLNVLPCNSYLCSILYVQLSTHATCVRQAASAQRGELLSVIATLEQEARQRAEGLEAGLRTNTLEMQVRLLIC